MTEATELEKLAADTRYLLEQIPTYRIQPSTGGQLDGPRPAPASRVLIDVVYWDLARGSDLWNWCTLVIDEMVDQDEDDRIDGSPNARNPTIAAMCSWLAKHADWIITYNDDFPDDIAKIHAAYRRAAGIKAEIVYRCSQCDWRVEPQDGQTWYRCTGCGKTWTMATEIDRLMRGQSDVMTLGQIAKETGIPHPTLRRWAGKRFSPVGERHGRPLYDIRTVRRAAERIRDTKQAS